MVLSFDLANGPDGDVFVVCVNGEVCGAAESVTLAKPCPEEPAWRYGIPLAALQEGYNVIELQTKKTLTVNWVELAIIPSLV